MRTIHEIETPVVLIDLDVLERNIAAMAEACRADNVRLRPHIKTHKCPEIARLQMRAGAAGLTLAKTSEAEVFAAAGFDDLFIAYPVIGADKAHRLFALSHRARIAVGVDSLAGATTLAKVFAAAERRLDVLLEIDVGHHRSGVAAGQALAMAIAIAELPGLSLHGVFTHAGQAYLCTTPDQIERVGRDEATLLISVADELRKAGLAIHEVSVGSTPTASHACRVAGVSECRPGNYIFHDASQVGLGTCALDDCALTVIATVVSVPTPDRAILDAGSKTLSSDPSRPVTGEFGRLLGHQSSITRLTEEHAEARITPGEIFTVGQRVRILPNHACTVVNLHDRLLGVRGETIATEFVVSARGCVQ